MLFQKAAKPSMNDTATMDDWKVVPGELERQNLVLASVIQMVPFSQRGQLAAVDQFFFREITDV